jgi:hypothetical protein
MVDKKKPELEPLTTRIPTTTGNKLRVHVAKNRGSSIQAVVTRALEELFAREAKKGKKKKKSESQE